MTNPELSDVHFSDKQMSDTFGPQLGNLAAKIALSCDDDARNVFGKTYFPRPSTVELTPYINSADGSQPEIVVRAWHETGIPGKSAVFQMHDTVVEMTLSDEDAFLSNKDTNTSYPLTTREAFLLRDISTMALVKHIHDSRSE